MEDMGSCLFCGTLRLCKESLVRGRIWLVGTGVKEVSRCKFVRAMFVSDVGVCRCLEKTGDITYGPGFLVLGEHIRDVSLVCHLFSMFSYVSLHFDRCGLAFPRL